MKRLAEIQAFSVFGAIFAFFVGDTVGDDDFDQQKRT